MLRPVISLFFTSICIGFLSCTEESNPEFDSRSFVKIYDDNNFDSAYYPIDVKQTQDEGYLILAKKKLGGEFTGIYMLKTDQFGNFVTDNSFPENLVNPIGTLISQGGYYYFFGMDATTTNAHLFVIDENAVVISDHMVGINYPCAASADGNNFVLLGYDNVSRTTVLGSINASGDILRQQNFTVGVGGEDQVEEDVINSFFQYGRKLPYLAGRIPGGLYYFNGFYNYTFSLVFTDLTSENPNGVIQGQHEDGGFSAALPLGGNDFAASVFHFGDNFIIPNQTFTVSSSSPSVAVDLGGFTLPELVPNATIRIMEATINGTQVLIYAGDTKSKQIGLWFYNKASGAFLSSRYFGFSNPFEIGNIAQTADNGLIICGTTYLAGRFPRICIFKISEEELASQVK